MSGFAYSKDNHTSEPTMLDVHPPHAPTHTWKDFFIHVGTICVGLLIAVGLEQTVEAIHHRHLRHELEEQLHAEAEHNLDLVQENLARLHEQRAFVDASIVALNTAPVSAGRIDTSALPQPRPQLFAINVFQPSQTAWTVARSSGTIALLPKDAAQVYARLDHEADVLAQETALSGARRSLAIINRSRQGLPPSEALSLNLAQREEFLQAYASLSNALRITILLELNEAGACRGVLHGAHSVDQMLQFMLEEDKQASKF